VLTLSADSTIILGEGNLSFDNSLGSTWTGNLNLTGVLGPTTLRFGSSANALTFGQLAQINLNGQRVTINENGYIVLNSAPTWLSTPVLKADATQGAAYSASISSDATDIDIGATLTFAKVGGPAWLALASDSTLFGTPTGNDIGINTFTVSVTDGASTPVTTTLRIKVRATGTVIMFFLN